MRFWQQSVLVQFNLVHVVVLACKHKLLIHLVSFVRSLLGCVLLLTFLLHFLHSVRVSESVEGVLYTSVGWANVGDHGGFRVASERVFQDLG